jgi:hypothetical protein
MTAPSNNRPLRNTRSDAHRDSRPDERPRAGARRVADRHYVAVVAEEARRLARQLRPPAPPRPPVLRRPAEGL